jgi:hypothetical protein
MDSTTIILIVAATAAVFLIYLRFFKKQNDDIKFEEIHRKDEVDDSPETESTLQIDQENEVDYDPEEITDISVTEEEIQEENKEYDAPEEEITRIIPDEEINQVTDVHEQELLRITNYFISSGIKNLTGNDFFDLQENIILDSQKSQADLYSDIHQIFQVAENRFIAITDLPWLERPGEDQDIPKPKAFLGIIECRKYIGKGRLEQFLEIQEPEKETDEKESEQAELVAELFLPETELKIGGNLLFHEGIMDMSVAESLSREIEKFSDDYYAFIEGSSVYIRLLRPASLVDLKTMIEILGNFHC